MRRMKHPNTVHKNPASYNIEYTYQVTYTTGPYYKSPG